MKAHHTLAHGESLVDSENPRECPMCGKVFASKGGMRAHHKLIHAESIAESRNITQSIRRTVLERDGYSCQRCNTDVTPNDQRGPNFQLHHLIPFSAGGPDHPENLVVLCNDCHTDVHQKMRSIVGERPELLSELQSFVCDD